MIIQYATFFFSSKAICSKICLLQPIPSLFPDQNISGDINECFLYLRYMGDTLVKDPLLTGRCLLLGGSFVLHHLNVLCWTICHIYGIAGLINEVWNYNASFIGYFLNVQLADAVNKFVLIFFPSLLNVA